MKKYSVGIIGATGVVGQRYVALLDNHPWFEISLLAASKGSAQKKYSEAIEGRRLLGQRFSTRVENLIMEDASNIDTIANTCELLFCAIDMPKNELVQYEESLAKKEIMVVSNNSACRSKNDVPMIIPEVNAFHLSVLESQRKRLHTERGAIVVKPNCSIQSTVIPMHALKDSGFLTKAAVITTMQAVSGAGRPGVSSLDSIDNVIPYISGEEEKTVLEPLKIFGSIENGVIVNNTSMSLEAYCNRVNVVDGHMATCALWFLDKKPSLTEAYAVLSEYKSVLEPLELPLAPKSLILVHEEANRPQSRLDRDLEKGMAISLGRLKKGFVSDLGFVSLSHNAIRGAAGGGVLNAELITALGWLKGKGDLV